MKTKGPIFSSVRTAIAIVAAVLFLYGCATKAAPGQNGELPVPRENREDGSRDGSAAEASAAPVGSPGEKAAPEPEASPQAVPRDTSPAAPEAPPAASAAPAPPRTSPPAATPAPAAAPRPRTSNAQPASASPAADAAPTGGARPPAAAPQASRPPRAGTEAPKPEPSRPAAPRTPAPAASETPPAEFSTAPAPRTGPSAAEAPPQTPSSAGSAGPQTRPSTGSVPVEERIPPVSAEIGRPIEISLTGIGWIYLGDEDNTGAIKYQGKETVNGNTIFSFLAFQKGDYKLKFQQQNLPANSINHENVRVAVAPGAAAEDASPAGKTVEPPVSAPAGVSRTQPAVRAPAAAEKPAAEISAADAGGAVSAGAPQASAETDEERYRRLVAENRVKEAAAEIEEFLRAKKGAHDDLDAWYFKLAELYDRDPEMKNMKKALYYYERVRDLYPMSPFWEAAAARSRYIRVNFIEIR